MVFPNVRFNEFVDVLENSSRASYLRDLRDKSCGQRLDVSKLDPQRKLAFTAGMRLDLFEKIDQQLDTKNITEIFYNGYVLTDDNFEMPGRFGDHSSIIVGRRFNKNTQSCEYLIRNSAGPACENYRKSLTCEKGNIWVPQEELITDLRGVTYLN